jgi:hypothetical protein
MYLTLTSPPYYLSPTSNLYSSPPHILKEREIIGGKKLREEIEEIA